MNVVMDMVVTFLLALLLMHSTKGKNESEHTSHRH